MRNPKSETLNPKQIQILNAQSPISKHYDLEERTLKFAKRTLEFASVLPKTLANNEISKQLIRATTAVGANYIEANESLSKKDFAMRIKICRKEAKESIYWLKLVEIKNGLNEAERSKLIQEATELMKIFGAIVEKSK